ncbi:MAG: tRNA glutamyl-Q(34) synthetase GluQRS [Planctomycetia bacterium]
MRSRLAPSPTGHLHVGNARTFLLTWLHVRAAGGSLLLRIDDLDTPRVRQEAIAGLLEDLRWLGLAWDEPEAVLRQSQRAGLYAAAAERLRAQGLAYPCTCTRKEVEEAASAPHGAEGPRYPGTCRGRWSTLAEAEAATGKPACLRLVVAAGAERFTDLLYGPQAVDVAAETGDFVIHRNSGVAAYQLATVVDDAASGADLVLRASDLLPSTARQRLLQRALGLPLPATLHLPLVLGEDGRRLAKRHGDTALATLRAQGWTPEELLGRLAWTAGLARHGEAVSLATLLSRYDPARLGSEAVVFRAREWQRAPGA